MSRMDGGRQSEKRTVACGRTDDVMRMVLDVAREHGATRGMIADRLGVSPATVDHWCRESSDAIWPAWALMVLLSDASILGDVARMALARKMLNPGGLGVMELPAEAGDADASMQSRVLESVTHMGSIADEFRSAIDDGRVDATEARGVKRRVLELYESLGSLVQDLDGAAGLSIAGGDA